MAWRTGGRIGRGDLPWYLVACVFEPYITTALACDDNYMPAYFMMCLSIGFAADEVLYDENDNVRGIATKDAGIAKDGRFCLTYVTYYVATM